MAFPPNNNYSRFTGRKHKPESNQKRSEALKKFYADRAKNGLTNSKYDTEEERQAARKLGAQRYKCKKYGLTLDEYYLMIEQQNNVCKICEQPETAIDSQTKQIKRLAIDHCHGTNKVRGLLCMRCNHLIGKAEDSIELFNKAIEYLRMNK